MVKAFQLSADRRVDRRLVVPVHGDPQRRDPVQVTAPVGVVEVHALAAVNDQRLIGRPLCVLGERMPDRGDVPGDETTSTSHGSKDYCANIPANLLSLITQKDTPQPATASPPQMCRSKRTCRP